MMKLFKIERPTYAHTVMLNDGRTYSIWLIVTLPFARFEILRRVKVKEQAKKPLSYYRSTPEPEHVRVVQNRDLPLHVLHFLGKDTPLDWWSVVTGTTVQSMWHSEAEANAAAADLERYFS